jgi:hypothetical protein
MPRSKRARGKTSVDGGFQRLRRTCGPHGAVELMNKALREKRARLFCDGVEVDPGFIRTHLVVKARHVARRWSAEIEATRALAKPVEAYTWEVVASDIEALTRTRADPSPPRRRGRATTHDWFGICAEIARRCIDPKTGRVRVPKSERALARAMLAWCQNEPAESEMREAVRQVCAALREAER